MKKLTVTTILTCSLTILFSLSVTSCKTGSKGINEPEEMKDFTETVLEGFTLASPIGDHMVIQRGKPFCVWGSATPGVKVMAEASWAPGSTYGAVTDSTGLWKFFLPTAQFVENDPNTYELRFHNATEERTISDLVIGDVWVLCGQSNMGISVGQAKDKEVPALAQQAGGKVRFFTPTGHEGNPEIQEFYEGAAIPWCLSDSVSVKNCSAIGYSFALNLANTLNVPIGIVNVSMGACTLQSFMPVDELVRDSTLNAKYYEPFTKGEWIVGYRPGWMYNSLVHPMRHISKTGFLWYQGEGNTSEWDTYAYAQAKMMECWRERFGGEMDAPYYYVQLSSYKDDFRYVREAQADVRNYTSNTAMAVSFDKGDYEDIHPGRKAEVGRRASLLALNNYYGLKDIVCEGPRFTSAIFEDGYLKLSFSSAEGLTTSDGEAPKYFEIRQKGQEEFSPAEAQIHGEQIWLKASGPDFDIRYAFIPYCEPNLYNAASLPAEQFRTDK